MKPIPTSLNPIPYTFFINLLIPTLIFFSTIVLSLLFIIPITCCTVSIQKKTKMNLVIFTGSISTILWFVSLKGILSDFFDSSIDTSNSILETVDTVMTNIDYLKICVGNFTEDLNLEFVTDIETTFEDYKSIVIKWYGVGEIVIIALYSLLGTSCLIFQLFVWKRMKIAKILIAVVISLVLFITFLSMVPLSNAIYSGLSYVCGSNIEDHNLKINSLISAFDKSIEVEDFCTHEHWEYVCFVQSCENGDQIFSDFINTSMFEEFNTTELGSNCELEEMEHIVNTTIDETLSCSNIRGYYERIVNDIVCDKVYVFAVFTLWPVGIATIFTIMLLTFGFLRENDYIKLQVITNNR